MKALFTALALTLFTGSAFAAEVKSAIVDEKAATLTVVAESANYCNMPKYDIIYLRSGRAAFGPYHFQLEETPIGRKKCRGTKEVTLVFGLQKVASCSINYRQVYLFGENGSQAVFHVNAPVPAL
jgi:hypothetical protein